MLISTNCTVWLHNLVLLYQPIFGFCHVTKAMAQAMAGGFENLKPRPVATGQALGLAWSGLFFLAWLGFWLPGQTSTSLVMQSFLTMKLLNIDHPYPSLIAILQKKNKLNPFPALATLRSHQHCHILLRYDMFPTNII